MMSRMSSRMLVRVLGGWVSGCVLALLVGCAEDEADASPPTMCLETEQCMLDECRDEFEALAECVEATGSSEDCDQPNFAHGHCLEDCGFTELPEEEVRDAAFALYLCEVSDEADCSEEAMACGE